MKVWPGQSLDVSGILSFKAMYLRSRVVKYRGHWLRVSSPFTTPSSGKRRVGGTMGGGGVLGRGDPEEGFKGARLDVYGG